MHGLVRLMIVVWAVVGVVSGVAAIAAAVIVVGGLATGIVAAILPTLGLIRAVDLGRGTPALIVILVGASIAVSVLLHDPSATRLGVTAFLFAPVVAGEVVRYFRRKCR